MSLILDATDGTLPAETEERFVALYAASVFFRTALFTGDDLDLTPLVDALTLTERGEERVEALAEAGFDAEEATAGLFGSFYWDDFFIDVEATDPVAVTGLVGALLTGGGLALPWLFGRELHDRYSATHISDHFALDEDETASLLDGTEPGVFQTGRLVSGPYGLLTSRERRLFPPNAVGPGVSCSDPGCERLHSVTLDSKEHPAYDAYEWLDEPDHNEAPLVRGLHGAFENACGLASRHMDDANPATLPLLLANAFSARERCEILGALITADASLVDRWPAAVSSTVRGKAHTPRELSDAASLQLCLTASDRALVSAIDRTLTDGRIVIPPREIRTPVMSGVRIEHGYFDVQAEVSQLGVRFRSRRFDVATLRFARLLRGVADGEAARGAFDGVAEELLAVSAPDLVFDDLPFDDRLRAATLRADPRALLARFVLADPIRAASGCKRLGLPRPTADDRSGTGPAGPGPELVDRMLWKLGFRLPRHESPVAAFWAALRHAEAELPHGANTADGRLDPDALDALRASATLLLPVASAVLEHALSFSAWALLTDHYRDGEFSRFEFDAAAARAITVSTLNGLLIEEGQLPGFNADGPTDLGTVMEGFAGLARVSRALYGGDRAGLAYGADQLPKWAPESDLFSFPFRHRHVLLDLEPAAAEALCVAFEATSRDLAGAKVASVLGRLAQSVAEPPSLAEIAAAWAGLRGVVEHLEAIGACPSVYSVAEERTDEHGRSHVRLVDYRGHALVLADVHELALAGLPTESATQLVFHGARLDGSGLPLRFRFNETSTYTARWRRYAPKRISPPRARTRPNDASAHDAPASEPPPHDTPAADPEGGVGDGS